jgi:hypothetical protein
MTRPTTSFLAGVGTTIALLALPGAAVAAPPAGECPSSWRAASVHDVPASFFEAALKIDANDDLVVCFKPMANATRTNVIDNISHPG